MSLHSGKEVVFCMNAFENVAVKQKSSSSLANVVFKKIALEQNLSTHSHTHFQFTNQKNHHFVLFVPHHLPHYICLQPHNIFSNPRVYKNIILQQIKIRKYYTTTNTNTYLHFSKLQRDCTTQKHGIHAIIQ